MTPEKAFAKRVNILQSCIDELTTAYSNKKANVRAVLESIRNYLNDYPDFEPSGKLKKADRFTVLAISKINMGLLEDIPPKEAIKRAYRYLCEALSLLVDNN